MLDRRISKLSSVMLTAAVAFVLLLAWIFFSELNLSSDSRYGMEALIAAIVWVSLLAIVALREGELSYFWVLLLISYPFFFGQQVIAGLGLETTRRMINLGQLNDDVSWDASFFISVSVIVVTLGYLFTRNAHRRIRPAGFVRTANIDNIALRRACILVACVIALPTIYCLVRNIALSSSVGYGARISDDVYSSHGISNWYSILAQIMPIALLGLVVTRRPGEKWQIALLCIYFVLYLASGSRITIFSFIPVLQYIWSSLFSDKPLRTQLARFLIAAVVIGAIFSTISLIRGLASSAAGLDLVTALAENNAIVGILQEAGQTFVVTAAIMTYVPDTISFTDGITYLAGIAYILPNQLTGNYYSSVPSVDDLISPYLVNYGGVGSSFVAEGFLNFGFCSIFLFVIYGLIIGKLTDYADKMIERQNVVGLFVASACFLFFAFYIRSDVRTFPRNFVWAVLPVLITQQVFQAGLTRNGRPDSHVKMPGGGRR